MMIDSKPTRRLIESYLCKFTFPLLANIISSYIPSDLGSQIVNFLQIFTAFCGIRRVALNHRAKAKIYTTHLRYPSFLRMMWYVLYCSTSTEFFSASI